MSGFVKKGTGGKKTTTFSSGSREEEEGRDEEMSAPGVARRAYQCY
jgi:hypothetical protein